MCRTHTHTGFLHSSVSEGQNSQMGNALFSTAASESWRKRRKTRSRHLDVQPSKPSKIKSCFDAQTSLQDSSSRPLQRSSMNAARSTDPVQAPKRTEGRRPAHSRSHVLGCSHLHAEGAEERSTSANCYMLTGILEPVSKICSLTPKTWRFYGSSWQQKPSVSDRRPRVWEAKGN